MLYDRWREVAVARRQEIALRDAVSARSWSFGELLAQGDGSARPAGPVVFPCGTGPDFILEVLRGWRHGCLGCPLDTGQEAPPFPRPPEPIVHLKVTSATTGRARLVAFTADQLAADARNIVTTMGLREDWPNLGAISLAHSYGFSNLVLPLLLHGIPLILAGTSLPEALRRAAQGQTALTLAGVPVLWRAWQEAAAIPAGVRLAISAGAPLPSALEQSVFDQAGLKIHNFYGASECGGIAYDRTSVPRADAALAGAPMDNVELRVAGDGCLEVRGANVATCYWPEPTPTLAQGVFRTADLAEFQDGQVLLRGRAGDVIHVAGRKVAPEEIERVLLAHPSVQDCVVVGLPETGGNRGEIITAVVVAPTTTLEALRAFVVKSLPPWQVPRQWHLEESLGTSERGKISRALWRDRLVQRGATGQAPGS